MCFNACTRHNCDDSECQMDPETTITVLISILKSIFIQTGVQVIKIFTSLILMCIRLSAGVIEVHLYLYEKFANLSNDPQCTFYLQIFEMTKIYI